jgi:hypothetical protein
MNARTILTGIAGGILLSLTMEYPLYRYLPSPLIPDWPPASLWIAVLLVVVGLFLTVGIGAVGALVSDASGKVGAAAAGAFTGLTAAWIVMIWAGGPAAGMWGSRTVLTYGLHSAQDDTQFLQLLLESTAQAVWWTFSSVWLAGCTGAVLGAAGGMLAGRGRISGRLSSRLWPMVLFPGTACAAAAAIYAVLTISTLGPQILETARTIGYALSVPDFVVLYFPSLSGWLLLLIGQAAGFLSLRKAPKDDPADLALLGILSWLFGWLPFITFLISLLFAGMDLFALPMLVVLLPSLLIGLLTLIQGWSLRPSSAGLAEGHPPGWRAFLSTAILGGCAAVFAVQLGILPFSLSVNTLEIPMISGLAPVESRAAGAPATTVSSSTMDMVQSNFHIQRSLLFLLVPACLLGGILTASAFWLLRRRMGLSGTPSRRTRLLRGGSSFLVLAGLIFLISVAAFILPMYAHTILF